jgi:arylsulfatase A
LLRHFSVASPVCSPSRAGLLTGRYPVRTGVPTVLTPQDTYGLNTSETTIAQMLKPAGYKTMCVGKWHLGSTPQHVPTSRGFDEFWGMLCSNDQSPTLVMHNTEVVEQKATQDTLTQRYTDQAVNFIRNSKDSPFFLYLPYTAPHLPLIPSKAFKGKSRLGVYGDVVQEMDWSVGQVMQELKANGLDDNTLVIFTSDNGPWFQGSAGELRGRKGDTFEGGTREPFLARFPGRIPAGQKLMAFASALDILPTIAAVTQTQLPPNVDGVDITPMLSGEVAEVARPPFLFFDGYNLQCARSGQWKLHMARYNTPAWSPVPTQGRMNLQLLPEELYDLYDDHGESFDCANENPDVVAQIQKQVADLLPTFPAEVQNAWAATINRPVCPNSSGALPSPLA